MSPDERWLRIESLYHAARERAVEERTAFLAAACAGDESLRQEVESLLAQVSQADLLEAGAFAGAAQAGGEPGPSSLLGRRLGVYFIRARLGAGGMGEVYRARDTTLGRDVAVKVLPAAVMADAAALERFEREARLLAALNHPNVAQVFGFEQADGIPAIVMELVEGPTLQDRISGGPIPVHEALALARQVAEGLEAAHERGIIHRDLKPANIKVSDNGRVKLLDFGLAKVAAHASPNAPSTLPTLDVIGTGKHTVVGTPAYMSPEQARGQPVDARTDVWAFGCVLYEVLTGRRVFARATISETIAAVLGETPAWEHLPRALSPSLVTYLKRCLEKDPRNRVHSVADVRLALKGAFEPEVPAAPPRSAARQIARWAVGVATIASLATWMLKPASIALPAAVTRSQIALPADQTFSRWEQESIALSPDGRRLAYVANEQIYLRRMEENDAVPVPGTEGSNPYGVAFAPDGNWLAFFSITTGRVVRVPVTGGAQSTVAEVPNRRTAWGLRWNRDNTLCYVDSDGIKRVPATGGSSQLVVANKPGEQAGPPQLLPDGQSLLFALTNKEGFDRWDDASIVIQSLESGKREVVWEGGSSPLYLPTGHLVFARGAALFAVRLDLERRTAIGEPIEVITGVARGGPAFGAPAQVSLSDTGTLSYVAGGSERFAPRRFVWVDRSGQEQAIAFPPDRYLDPRLSPEGTRVAVAVERSGATDIWVLDLQGGHRTRLTEPPGVNRYPLWTLDGTQVLFASSRDGEHFVYQKPASGLGQAQPMLKSENAESGALHSPIIVVQNWLEELKQRLPRR